MVDDSARDHQSRVQSTSGDSAKRVPGPVIEPVPERVEAMGDKVFGGAEVKPRVNYSNTKLVTLIKITSPDLKRKGFFRTFMDQRFVS